MSIETFGHWHSDPFGPHGAWHPGTEEPAGPADLDGPVLSAESKSLQGSALSPGPGDPGFIGPVLDDFQDGGGGGPFAPLANAFTPQPGPAVPTAQPVPGGPPPEGFIEEAGSPFNPFANPGVDPAFLNDPNLFRAIFAQQRDLPATGRSPYQQFIADQWRVAATEYALRGEGLGGGLGGSLDEPTNFFDFLEARTGPASRLQGNFLQELTDIPFNDQMTLFEGLGGFGDIARRQVFLGGLRDQFPSFIAEGIAQQAFSQPSLDRFGISPEATREINPVPFLNFLRQRFLGGN